MNINKIIVIPFKKSALGNLVYLCKPYSAGDVFFLPNTASNGDTDYTKIEAYKLLGDFGFSINKQKNITIDLGVLIYKKMNFKAYAVLVDDMQDSKKIPGYIEESSFMRVGTAVEKCTEPFKEFLQKFTNWSVV